MLPWSWCPFTAGKLAKTYSKKEEETSVEKMPDSDQHVGNFIG